MSMFPTNYRVAVLRMVANFWGRPLVFSLLVSILLPGFATLYSILVYLLPFRPTGQSMSSLIS